MFFCFMCFTFLDEEENEILSELHQKFRPKLVKYSMARLIDKSYAEDLVQTAFVILIKKFKRLKGGDLNSWLYHVVDNLIKNHNRAQKNRDSIVALIPIDSLRDEEVPSYDHDDSRVAELLLSHLSQEEADVFNTYFDDFLPHEQAAEKQGISISASKARKSRIRLRLIKILADHGIYPHDKKPKSK